MTNDELAKAREDARSLSRETVANAIYDLGKKHGEVELATKAIAEGHSIEKFKSTLFDNKAEYVVSSQSQRFSLVETILKKSDGDEIGKYEKSVMLPLPTHINTKAGMSIPNEFFRDVGVTKKAVGVATSEAHRNAKEILKRDLVASSDSQGGYTVDDELREVIQPLDPGTPIYDRATKIFLDSPHGNADLAYTRQTSKSEASWTGEVEAARESDITFDLDTITPKAIRVFCRYSRQLLVQASIDVENYVRSDVRQSIMNKLERDLLLGTGTGNQILGIQNISNLNTVNYGSAPTYDHILQVEGKLLESDAIVHGSNGMKISGEISRPDPAIAWITSNKLRRTLQSTPQLPEGELPIWDEGDKGNDVITAKAMGTPENPKILDYDATWSSNVPANDLHFANFRDLTVTQFGGVHIIVDPFSEAEEGLIRCIAEVLVHSHHRHANSFCRMTA